MHCTTGTGTVSQLPSTPRTLPPEIYCPETDTIHTPSRLKTPASLASPYSVWPALVLTHCRY